jgi:hypothetical protein
MSKDSTWTGDPAEPVVTHDGISCRKGEEGESSSPGALAIPVWNSIVSTVPVIN